MMEICRPHGKRGGVPLAEGVKAGFPSPAEDFAEPVLDLNSYVIKNPASTFYARIDGDSMSGAGISDGDIVVVDKSLEPADGVIAVCFIDGEFTLKRIRAGSDCLWLMPENAAYKPIRVTAENHFTVWGIVTYVIKKV